MRSTIKKAALILALALNGVMVTSAVALPKEQWVRFYYADQARTILIGEQQYTCLGNLVTEGQTSIYFRQLTTPCGTTGD